MKIDLNKMARRVEVDNRLPLPYYLRIADSLLRQASIYKEEKNIVDLYVILLRYTSLVTETIPSHRDYKNLPARDKSSYIKRSSDALAELESLKPDVKRRVDELNEEAERSQHCYSDVPDRTSFGFEASLEWPPANRISYSSMDGKQAASLAPQSLWKYENHHIRASSTAQIEKQLNKLSINLPLPKQDTLSRHSFLGPEGFHGQWLGPTAEIKVQYPSNTDLTSSEDLSINQVGQYGTMAETDSDSGRAGSDMDSVLSLDDGRWSRPVEESFSTVMNQAKEDPFQFVGVKQPSPPPVLAQVKHEYAPIPPSKVADPRPGPAIPSQDGMLGPNSYQHLHVPVNLMEDFLRLARANTARNLETCGVLAGLLKNRVFHITTLIIPKQESTSDSCQTLSEEEIFEVQDRLSLFPLGWIHTHPSQSCFMSSVDLHTHYSYQIMLPEAIAIVMAPTDETSPHGIFHLSDPGGVSVIRSCQQRGFHPHEEPLDGSPIYEHCSHVYMNSKLKFDVVDLR